MNIVILGSTGVIGKALVKQYQKENCIEASRKAVSPNIELDLSDFESILCFLKKLEHHKIDILFLNAATTRKEETKDHMEYSFMVNAFSMYYIAKHFTIYHKECRIVFTSSIRILHAKQKIQSKTISSAYRNTKLLAHLLLAHLQEEDPFAQIGFFHPGIVASKLSLSLHHRWVQFLIRHFGNSLEHVVEGALLAAEATKVKGNWVCPKGVFGLKGKPVLKKVNRSMVLDQKVKQYVIEKEKELEKKYGISCVRL